MPEAMMPGTGVCWRYWGCPEEQRKRCSVYAASRGDKCWRAEEHFAPKCDRHFGECGSCPWYRLCREE